MRATTTPKPLATIFQKTAFAHINAEEEELQSLVELFTDRTYAKKSLLLAAGNRWKEMFYIREGIIRLFYTDLEGREFNKGFFWEHHLVWPIAPRARKENSLFSIEAIGNVSAWVCDFKTCHHQLRRHGLWEKFALPYAESFAEEKFRREYAFLVHSATERYLAFLEDYARIAHRIPDYHLASFLGITNVSLSRIKRSLST